MRVGPSYSRAGHARPQRSRGEWLRVLQTMRAGHLAGRPAEEMYDGGLRDMHELRKRGAWGPGASILDVGCGNGRYALALVDERVRYLGLDPLAESVAFARRAFAPWTHLAFRHLDAYSPLYNPGGAIDPRRVILPAADASIDFVIMSSVFTHLSWMSVCSRYLAEARRVLRPGGLLFASWFRSPPNLVSDDPNRSVFAENDIRRAIAGFALRQERGGLSDGYHDQWEMLLQPL